MPEPSPSRAVELQQISRAFGETLALDRVSLAIDKGEFFSLLGPSGCGKTTLLRIVAGLEWPDRGELLISGQSMLAIPAHLRNVNTVFQSYALFPHLNVFNNVAFGLRMKKAPEPEITRRVAAAMEMVEIGTLGKRKPDQLSGGQKQRVALARALINEPEVLLLDEPLAAIDARLRKQLQAELQALQKRLGITFIYVTHDQEEALVMSSRIAVMNHGRIEQLGTPSEIYEFPRTCFVASFLGGANILTVTHSHTENGALHLDTICGRLICSHPNIVENLQHIAIRPEKFQIQKPGAVAPNHWSGIVAQTFYTGPERHASVIVNGQSLRCSQPNDNQNIFQPGDPIALSVAPENVLPLLD